MQDNSLALEKRDIFSRVFFFISFINHRACVDAPEEQYRPCWAF